MFKLNDPITKLKGISDKSALKLESLKIYTIKDLLYHFPFRYDDTSNIVKIKDVVLDNLSQATLKVTVDSISNNFYKGKRLTRARAHDDTGKIDIVWFNQTYLTTSITPGTNILIYGKCKVVKAKVQFISPSYEIEQANKKPKYIGTIIPTYSETSGINSKWLRNKIGSALNETDITETLSLQIIERQKFISLKDAIHKIHFPSSFADTDIAIYRLGFEELYFIQLKVVQKMNEKQNYESTAQKIYSIEIDAFLRNFDFTPTAAQINSVKEILNDLEKPISMDRLLEGDVGSGKTLVAAAAAYNTFKNGFDTALMVPTSILAMQHEKTFNDLFNKKVDVIALTSKTSKKIKLSKKPAIYIGTHALLFKKEIINNLGLVIIDEQHRFGVRQRDFLTNLLNKYNKFPHLLTMTATPIPRTLAQTFFGDIDLSILDELPKGRIPVKTFVVNEKERVKYYKSVQNELNKGNQVFVICPMIEQSLNESMSEIKNATHEFENIKKIFPNVHTKLVHGKIKEPEKSEILSGFKNKEFDILVSTSVVEVGIDIPNATVILIESAERFGLAQLHQLRGRVGRSTKESYCLLYHTQNKTNERLEFFASHNKGIELAEFDLKNRGPGEVYGVKQSGLPELKIASIMDIEMVQKARYEAVNTLQKIS